MSATFLFAGLIAICVFTVQSIANWLHARSAERRMHERYTLLARLAEQPRESAELVLQLLREDDEKEAALRHERRRAKRRDGMMAGGVLVATGVGLTVFLAGLSPTEPVWPIGLMIVLMGAVVFGFAWTSSRGEPPAGR